MLEHDMKTLFTVVPKANAGFTDQLTTLALAYDIGTRCGCEFRLTPFTTLRSGHEFWSRYDLSRRFPVLSAEESMLPQARVELTGARARACDARTPQDLVAMVADQMPAGTRMVVIEVTERDFVQKLMRWDESPGMLSFRAELRKVFAPRHAWAPARGLRVLLHLRCGDTADVPLIGPVHYRAWGTHVRVARPALATPFVGARLVMDVVRDLLGPGGAEFRVFTDGYERTAHSMMRSAGTGGTITAGLAKLMERAIGLHGEAARAVMTGEDVTFSAGESLESLDGLIHAAQHADIIVCNAAQRLSPKLLAVLDDRDRRPGLLVLDPQRHLPVRQVRLSERHVRLINLSMHGDPLAPLRAFLATAADPTRVSAIEAIVEEAGAGAFCIPELEPLAATLEVEGRDAQARAVYEWLGVLSDGSPGSLAGAARCAARLGDDMAAEEYRRRAAEATRCSVANYRAAIAWATSRGYRLDAEALRDEARGIVGPDADLP
jgi:hypothetical protein